MTTRASRWIMRWVVAIALFASAGAAAKPRGKTRAKQRHSVPAKPTPMQPAGATADAPTPVGSGQPPAPPPAPSRLPGSPSAKDATSAAPARAPKLVPLGGTSAAPAGSATAGSPLLGPTPSDGSKPSTAPVVAPVEPPRKAPKLAMRPRASSAHGGFIDRMDCSACHTATGWEVGIQAGKSGFDHDLTGFPLRGAHRQSDCSRCHNAAGKPATVCEGCHADPHQGRTTGTCAECHTATAWRDTNALERHRSTRMPLTGRHATIDCVACHRRQSERQYSATPTDCYACHRAEYHGNVHPTHDGTGGQPMFPRECGMCHQTSGWSPALRDPSASVFSALSSGAHDAFFVLSTGSHRGAECGACHFDPRRNRLVRCDGCHSDVALRDQHQTAIQTRTATACLFCHPRGARR